jgi:hypothetical protein
VRILSWLVKPFQDFLFDRSKLLNLLLIGTSEAKDQESKNLNESSPENLSRPTPHIVLYEEMGLSTRMNTKPPLRLSKQGTESLSRDAIICYNCTSVYVSFRFYFSNSFLY